MTITEFEKTYFKKGMSAKYCGYVYKITSCNFKECLIELTGDGSNYVWARCENIELVEMK